MYLTVRVAGSGGHSHQIVPIVAGIVRVRAGKWTAAASDRTVFQVERSRTGQSCTHQNSKHSSFLSKLVGGKGGDGG